MPLIFTVVSVLKNSCFIYPFGARICPVILDQTFPFSFLFPPGNLKRFSGNGNCRVVLPGISFCDHRPGKATKAVLEQHSAKRHH